MKQTSINLLSWNVAGIKEKLSNPDWLAFVSRYSILCFQETWARNKWYMDGYSSFCLLAMPARAGRAKGVLCILVSTSLPVIVTEINCSSHYFQMVWISNLSTFHILLINYYNNCPKVSNGSVVADLEASIDNALKSNKKFCHIL